jgi:hypothetical protein
MEDELAAQTYAAEGAEIIPWTGQAAVPITDNAALLYYQALSLCPELNETPTLLIDEVLRGAAPDDTIRTYLGHCRRAIHTTELASHIPQCNWALQYPDDRQLATPFISQTRRLALALAVDAHTLAADGHYRAALTRCLTLRRLASHLANETSTIWALSIAIDGLAGAAIQHVLGTMPPDSDMAIWLRSQLATIREPALSLPKALENDLGLMLNALRTERSLVSLDELRQLLDEIKDNNNTPSDLSDEALLARIRAPYARLLDGINQILDGDLTYTGKRCALREQIDWFQTGHRDTPLVTHFMGFIWIENIDDLFDLQIRNRNQFNALKAAIDVYAYHADLGQLPNILPPTAPRDPFSDQDFEYEVTEAGFIIRCRAKDLCEDRIWEYEFVIQD